ncbi:hypothetical protein LTR66_013332 [Elasticomyces elasticus]|nr:hypothetical protein LTR66_013332 [Elasticomyces elasticus]
MFGILGWAASAAHGPGIFIQPPSSNHGSALSWSAVFGLQSFVGAQASGCLGQSDWTRYARTPKAALFGQLIAAPICICVTAICGTLITSAAATIYGKYLWNPFELLLTIQHESLSPGARAGTFFAGLGFLASQLALRIVLNCVSSGIDLAALCPEWMNIRRGSHRLSLIAIAICTWNYVTKPTTFITVLSGWRVFLSPMTGIICVAYRYNTGLNFRRFAAWVMGLWPLLPGFARAVQGVSAGNGWDHLYDIGYFYGFFVAVLVYWALHVAFPSERQTGGSPFVFSDRAMMLKPEGSRENSHGVDACSV